MFFHRSDEDEVGGEAQNALDVKLILEYGTLLMCHKSLWQIGLCYLDQCHEEGRARQHTLLSKIIPTSDIKAIKLMQAALSRGLLDVGAYQFSHCKIITKTGL